MTPLAKRVTITTASLTLIALIAAATSVFASTDAACGNAYDQSSAKSTCTLWGNGVKWDASQNRCRIQARCQKANGGLRTNNALVTVNEAKQLSNCNGWLVIGNC